ncbi:MAG TPA: helix-hairpin-helix domain-containing protein [Euzebya sp.]|nr:helix-hairpin-helix domain-containing protein [Euzebya sp.]
MRRRVMQLVLLMFAAAGGVVWWQRRNETPPTPPEGAVPTRLRPAEPFMDPAPDRAHIAAVAIPPAGTPPLPRQPRSSFTTAPDGPADDLKRITGVGPKLESLLNEQGIITFAQLAALSEDDIDRLQDVLQFPGRIRRDRWVEQAARLGGA